MSTHSCIYEGIVRHRRYAPVLHDFEMPLFMMYLDLDELPGLFRGTWSSRRPALGWFRRRDYLANASGDRTGDLAEAARSRVHQALGFRPDGPIRLLTHLRYFGTIFNPVSFYYCFDAAGTRVRAIVAEITNTPWKQRHAYVLDGAAFPPKRSQRFRFDKVFHVSPLMPMDLGYDWGFSIPVERTGSKLGVNMVLNRGSERVFDATLALTRTEISRASLRSILVRYPFMTARVVARIHVEAFKTWRKGAGFHPNPASVERRRAKEMGRLPAVAPTTTGVSA